MNIHEILKVTNGGAEPGVPVDDAALVDVMQRGDELPREVARARLRKPAVGRAVYVKELSVVAARHHLQHQTVERLRLQARRTPDLHYCSRC